MTYSWQNEEGEPIMSGEAWRFEQQLDMDAQADYYADTFCDNEPADEYEECDNCGGDIDPSTDSCYDCGHSNNALASGRAVSGADPSGRPAGSCNCARYGHAHLCPHHTQEDFEAADRAIGRTGADSEGGQR